MLHSVSQAQTPERDSFPYDLNNPFFTVNLANEALKEISGLGISNNANTYVAIADEVGKVYFIDGESGRIDRIVSFKDKGDFEGVEMVGSALFALKSNGDIYEIDRWKRQSKMRVKVYETPLSKTDDVEGLGYDPARNALLLACKGDPDSSYLRKIFAWDLKTKQLSASPVYVIDPQEIRRLAPDLAEEKAHFFSPSGVAIRPGKSEIYVISTAKKRLVVLDYKTGKVLYAVRIDKNLLPQPEGISFDKEGNLLISSEGKKGNGMVLKFRPRL